MFNSSPKHYSRWLGWEMFFIVLTCFTSIYFISNNYQNSNWVIVGGFILLWLLIRYLSEFYDNKPFPGLTIKILLYIKVYIILIILLLLFQLAVPMQESDSRLLTSVVLGFPILALSTNHIIANIRRKMKPQDINTKYTLIAGIGSLAEKIEKNIYKQQHLKYQVRGFIKCKNEECTVGQDRVVGDLEHINEYLKDNTVDEIVIALPTKISKKVQNIIAAADYHGVRVKYIPDYGGLLGNNYKLTRYGQLDAVNVRALPLDKTSAFLMKNSFDVVFSMAALLALAPFFLILAILIKLDSPGPVFYCPIRIGKGGRPFKVFKFRTMQVNDTASGGVLSTEKDDPRITRLGKILRKFSLDELPQFMNVLIGDMSVVGPRPHRSYLNQQLQASVDKYMIRHYFKPGITGWAQVNGWRGPTSTDEQRKQRTYHDLWYMENWSFMLDIKIVFMTLYSSKVHKTAF